MGEMSWKLAAIQMNLDTYKLQNSHDSIQIYLLIVDINNILNLKTKLFICWIQLHTFLALLLCEPTKPDFL